MTETKTAAATKARILIVDDHALVRRGLAGLIEDEGDLIVCGEAGSAAEALTALATRPDLIIVDLSLQTGHGLDLIRQLKARDEELRILVLSMHDESLFAERVLRAGALGYVSKQEAPGQVISAIRQVLDDKVYLSQAMTERLLRRASGREADAVLPGDTLSDRELTVFQMIGEGLPTREIATRLHLSVKTIETYRENIKAKLGLKNSAELSRHAAQWVLEHS
jgi:DNA-binding NarL/FixJ family response regulator